MVYGRAMRVEVALDAIISRTDLEPCEHELPRRELGLAYLVSHDERPYQAQDQLQVAVHDVHVTWKNPAKSVLAWALSRAYNAEAVNRQVEENQFDISSA